MIKEMYKYGYKYIGVIPVKGYKEAWKEFANNNKSVLILYPDGTEAYVEDTSDFFRLKNEVMYALERDITETKLIKKAIDTIRAVNHLRSISADKKIDDYNRGYWAARSETYAEVLEMFGFSDEEILLMVKEADLGVEE